MYPMFCVLCPMSCVLCPMFCVVRPVSCVLCPVCCVLVFCVLFPVLCPESVLCPSDLCPQWRRVLRTPSPPTRRSAPSTIQAQEEYYSARKIAGRDQRKLCVRLGRFFINISGYMYSFGLALFVVQGLGSVQVVVAAWWSRKSICERFRWVKVPRMMII